MMPPLKNKEHIAEKRHLEVCPLASGSKGNSLWVSAGSTSILVDAGLSGVEIERRLQAVGAEAEQLSALVVTHEHSDHVRGIGVLSRRYNLPVYASPKTYAACQGLGKIKDLRFFECGTSFNIGPIKVDPFSISHDACDPAGLTMTVNGVKIGIATDLGIATGLVKERLKHCHLLYLESNHDPKMLMAGPYPWHLKQRIKGRTGHLSNHDTRELVSELMDERLEHVILAHLSEENNRPAIAAELVSQGLNGSGVSLHVAAPDKPGKRICLQGKR